MLMAINSVLCYKPLTLFCVFMLKEIMIKNIFGKMFENYQDIVSNMNELGEVEGIVCNHIKIIDYLFCS